jgi:glycine cleavage system H protein
MRVDEDLHYCVNHTWLRPADGRVRIGVDDFAQRLLGVADGPSFPDAGSLVGKGYPITHLCIGDNEVAVPAPLPGRVVAINTDLNQDRSQINGDPYGKGWLVEVEPSSQAMVSPEGVFYRGTDALHWMNREIERLYRLVHSEAGDTMADGGDLTDGFGDALTPEPWDKAVRTFVEGRN